MDRRIRLPQRTPPPKRAGGARSPPPSLPSVLASEMPPAERARRGCRGSRRRLRDDPPALDPARQAALQNAPLHLVKGPKARPMPGGGIAPVIGGPSWARAEGPTYPPAGVECWMFASGASGIELPTFNIQLRTGLLFRAGAGPPPLARSPRTGASSQSIGRAYGPSEFLLGWQLGRCPRLVWHGPLALDTRFIQAEPQGLSEGGASISG